MLVAIEKENWSKEILFSETKSLSAQRNWVFAVCDLWSLSSNLDLVWDTFSLRYMPILHFPLPTYSFMFSGSCRPHILRYMPLHIFEFHILFWRWKEGSAGNSKHGWMLKQKWDANHIRKAIPIPILAQSCITLKKSKSCITINKSKCTALLLNQS